jgi:hypothetical protein
MSGNLREFSHKIAIALKTGPISLITYRAQHPSDAEFRLMPIVRTAKGAHYISTLRDTKDFFPPVPLEWKGLSGVPTDKESICDHWPRIQLRRTQQPQAGQRILFPRGVNRLADQ